MSEATMPEALSPRKEYLYSPGLVFLWLPRIFVVAFFLIAVGYAYAWYLGHFQKAWLGLVAALWLLLAVRQTAGVYLISRARLVTTPNGLELINPWYTISSTWDNIAKLKGKPPLVYLRQNPTVRNNSPFSWLVLTPWGRKVLPMLLFQGSWPGELEQDFRRYAPHLFSAEDRRSASPL